MLKYKADLAGIELVVVEEKYTSGTSYVDNELPTKENYNKTLAGLTTKDPNGVREVTRSLKRAGVPQNAQTIVEAYRAQKGSSSSNGRTLHGIK